MRIEKIYCAMWGVTAHPFNALCKDVTAVRDPDELKNPYSLLVIWGGADINPAYYNHPPHSTTFPGGMRDRAEWAMLQRAIEMGIPIAGVCRGGQMLCAAAGGFLLQDVRNHCVSQHKVNTIDGKEFYVNSIHHQMMCGLEKTEHELVAWASPNRSPKYEYMDNKVWTPPDNWKEPEFVYFPKINGYAVQWHPEGLETKDPANIYLLSYIEAKETERYERAQKALQQAAE